MGIPRNRRFHYRRRARSGATEGLSLAETRGDSLQYRERFLQKEALLKTYFFFDIDGTLTQPLTAEVPESTREALRLLQARGHFVALATGRIQADAFAMARSLGLSSAVSDGGECVTLDGHIEYHNGLPLEACAEFLDRLDRTVHPWAVAPKNQRLRITWDDRYLSAVKDRYYETVVDPDLDYRKLSVIHKIFFACPPGTQHGVDLCGLPHVWLSADTMLIEPTKKEKGIQYVMKKYGLADSQIVVFGDGMNDRSMFRPEWMSVAMGNAKPALKEKAKYVTARADEDGIWKACRHFGWI